MSGAWSEFDEEVARRNDPEYLQEDIERLNALLDRAEETLELTLGALLPYDKDGEINPPVRNVLERLEEIRKGRGKL